MKFRVTFVGILLIFAGVESSYADFQLKPIDFVLTTDIIELLDGDIQGELMLVSPRGHSFAVRLGTYRTIEASGRSYPGNTRKFELGGRWRKFLMEAAPHFFFVGLGFDNRPGDNTLTPLAELGFNVAIKPFVAGFVTFWGYEIDIKNDQNSRFVKGFELRLGLGF